MHTFLLFHMGFYFRLAKHFGRKEMHLYETVVIPLSVHILQIYLGKPF